MLLRLGSFRFDSRPWGCASPQWWFENFEAGAKIHVLSWIPPLDLKFWKFSLRRQGVFLTIRRLGRVPANLLNTPIPAGYSSWREFHQRGTLTPRSRTAWPVRFASARDGNETSPADRKTLPQSPGQRIDQDRCPACDRSGHGSQTPTGPESAGSVLPIAEGNQTFREDIQ